MVAVGDAAGRDPRHSTGISRVCPGRRV